jgi:hypothetical protein
MNALFGFTHSVADENGKELIHDIDCEVEVEPLAEENDFRIEVVGVWIDGVELMRSKSPVMRGIGCDIAGAAEVSDWLRDQVYEWEGISYHGLGGNDPDGRLVRRVA